MATGPGGMLEFHIRAMDDGEVSNFVQGGVKEGDAVAVEGPYGAAYLRDAHRGPILAIAGGSGLAPIKAIVETALAKDMPQPIYFYFGVRGECDVYLEEELAGLASKARAAQRPDRAVGAGGRHGPAHGLRGMTPWRPISTISTAARPISPARQ